MTIYKCISFISKKFKILYQQFYKSLTRQARHIYKTYAGREL